MTPKYSKDYIKTTHIPKQHYRLSKYQFSFAYAHKIIKCQLKKKKIGIKLRREDFKFGNKTSECVKLVEMSNICKDIFGLNH